MRKKPNKADEMYIKANANKPAEEISEEIELSLETVKSLLKKYEKTTTNGVVKRARIKANDQVIGAMLTNEIADYVPPPKKAKESPHLYKSKKKD